jgi:hypothetical protein
MGLLPRPRVGIDDKDMLRTLAALFANPPLDWRTLFAEYPRKKTCFASACSPIRPSIRRSTPFSLVCTAVYKLAVVTSSARSEIDPLLTAGGLRHHFDALVGAEDVTRYKPDPEPYRKAAELLGARTAGGGRFRRRPGQWTRRRFCRARHRAPAELPALLTRRLAGA